MLNIPTEIRRYVIIGVLVALLCLTLAVFTTCTANDRRKSAEANRTIADARTSAASDVNDIRDKADARAAETTGQVKDIQDAIRSTDDPAERSRIAERGLCQLDPGSSPNCRVLLTYP